MSVTTPLLDVDFPEALFAANALIRQKVANFTFMTASLVIRVMVNAAPFQSGKLFGIFRPFSAAQGQREMTRNHFSSLTAFPRVEIDASAGNVGELEIPFVSPYNAWDLTANTAAFPLAQAMGTFQLYAMNALASSEAPTTCSYNVYAYFKDVVLTVPTCSRSTVAQEVEHTANPFGVMVRALPIAQGADDDLSLFSVKVQPAAGYTTIDACDQSTNLSLISTQETPKHNIASTEDDMLIANIVKRETLLLQIPWTTTQTFDDILTRLNVHPGACRFSNSVGYPTMLAFVSTFFTYWKGSLTYRFSVAKTAFHSGRLRISFVPGQASLDTFDPDNTYNVIWDLRESNEVSFTPPFVSSVPWKTCGLANYDGVTSQVIMTGQVYVSVLNPLLASTTVSDAVSINVWISSPDIEFRAPNRDFWLPHVATPPVPQVTTLPVAQVLGDEQVRDSLAPPASALAMPMARIGDNSLMSSEKVTSLRQLLKRFTLQYTSLTATSLRMYPSHFYSPEDDGPCSLIDSISYLYVFNYGSQRFKFYALTQNRGLMYVENNISDDHAFASAPFTADGVHDISSFVPVRSNPVLEVRAPYYSPNPQRVINAYAGYSGSVIDFSIIDTDVDLFRVLRAAGSDFEFGFLVGPPALIRP
jgi:hypothetical protein